ncbi:hypothetical protein FAES_3296 [Fibrella aestuarina BUZ 2]|uniref:Uncharacterized protein n=1 Tax=Fibrella aestuarina BUZ 2 TaxID=1166018 RepID=I0KB01_9BACT|nr:hypothetical protein [Fibrella aestuarina]CCH01304.1 hypothetical protein FAES_3296 [Fibrella aestuarina BUZ 2]
MTPTGGAGLIAALATPYDNIAGRSAARQEGLQLSAYITQQAQQEQQQEALAGAQSEQALQYLNALPFVGADKTKLHQYVRETVTKPFFERLATVYNGSAARMLAAEPGLLAQKKAELEQQPFYLQAKKHLEEVERAKAALAKGEVLVGYGDSPTNYRTGEAALADFLAGRAETFAMRGSYKPEDDLKELRNQYAPGKMPWEQTPVSEADKQAHLVNSYGADMGIDKYLRQHVGVPTYYKTDPITKKVEFQNDQQRLALEKSRFNLSVQQAGEASALRRKQGQLLDLKIAKEKGEQNGTAGMGFDYGMLSRPQQVIKLATDDPKKKLPHSGLDIGGMRGLHATGLFGEGEQFIASQLGLSKGKNGVYSKGSIKDAFTDANGVATFDLKDRHFDVVGVDPRLYYDPRDVGTAGLNPKGVRGFARVVVKFNNVREAEKAGLYDPNRLSMGLFGNGDATGMFDSVTKGGAGVYDPASMSATLFVPMGAIDRKNNFTFMRQQQIQAAGKKEASAEAAMPFLDTSIF